MVKKYTRAVVSVVFLSALLFMSIPMNQNLDLTSDTDQNGLLIEDQSYETNSSKILDTSSIVIHQSHTNYSRINFTESKSSYTVPAPLDTDFNTSQIYLGITNITATNQTIVIEDDTSDGSTNTLSDEIVSSFELPMDCIISNFTFYVEDGAFIGGSDADMYILNSTWDAVEKRNIPNTVKTDAIQIGSILYDGAIDSVTTDPINEPLNNINTANNTWFIGLNGTSGPLKWHYVDDSPSENNESYAYIWNVNSWEYQQRDYIFNVSIGLSSTTPSPSELKITVDNEPVSDSLMEINAGFFTSNTIKSGISGELDLNVSSLWHDYSFQINETVINYTKSNLDQSTFFTVENNKDVLWNTTVDITTFEAQFEEKSINYTVPANWYNIRVTQDGTPKTDWIIPQVGNQVVNVNSTVDNGEWILLANSTNLIDTLDISVDGTPRTFAYTNETVDFSANFDVPIVGDVNLTIYNPDPDVTQNYSDVFSVGSPTTAVQLGDWNVLSNISSTGLFRVQVTWNNDTDAAILESTIFIAKHTSIDITPASGYENETTSVPFNISITYKDLFSIGQPNVTGATIGYNLGLGDGWQTQVQTNPDEAYNITINPSDFSLGSHIIPITINKSGYYNYSINYIFNTVGTTQVEYQLGSSSIEDIIRGHNATFYLQYNTSGAGDTPIIGATISEVSLDGGLVWSYQDLTNGLYSITINTSAVDVGSYDCNFTIGKTAYFSQPIDFTIEVVQATLEIEIIGEPTEVWKYGGKNTTITFRLIDTDNSKVVTGMPTTFLTVYNGTSPTDEEWDFPVKAWEVGDGTYKVNLSVSELPAGPLINHSAILNVTYDPNFKSFNITSEFRTIGNQTDFSYIEIRKYSDDYELITENLQAHQYEIFSNAPGFSVYFNISDSDNGDVLVDNSSNPFIYNATLIEGTTETPLITTISFDPVTGKHIGTVMMPEGISLGTYQIRITINQLNYETTTFTMGLTIKEEGGIPIEILYAILVAILAVVTVIGVKRGIVDPRKRKYQERVFRTASIFEDAINMQHILIIYKNTGTCLYFKSFSMEEIDPDLISGFLQAAQSFVRESMASGGGLSEMKSGDSNLLISDGEMVRITLVLSKPASQFLKTNLSRLVTVFEAKYRDELQNWRGQLNIFKDSGDLVDEVLHTSIILPHEVTSDIKKRKQPASSMARSLMKIASGLTTASKNLFFIAQLVSEGKDKLKKDPQEILLGVNELIEKEIIQPIDLSKYETGGISDQELKLLAQKVADLPGFNDEEKQTLIQDLAEMNAAEREAALTSLQQGSKIDTGSSKAIVKTNLVSSEKEAKSEIKRLKKQAKKQLKDKDYQKAMKSYEAGEVVALQWSMEEEAQEFRDKILDAQIDRFDNKIKIGNKKVKKLIKSEDFAEAEDLAQDAYEAASSMFKLGFTEYQDSVKKFKNHLSEIENRDTGDSGGQVTKESKKSLLSQQKNLQKKASKLERKNKLTDALEIYSQLNIVADKLFKMGVVNASSDIKKYRVKINKLKREISESDEESIDTEQLLDQRSKLLNIALQAEKEEDYLKALVAYQQVLNTYYVLGDTDSASKLSSKISGIVEKIPNLAEVLDGIVNGAEQKYNEGSLETAFAQYQYAKGICEAISDVKKLKEIEKRIDQLSSEMQ